MLESERKRLLVASYHMAHDRTAPPEELRSMVEASPNDQQLIVGADANAHNCVWRSPDINDRVCKVVGWFKGGIKIIACDDERSAELYKAALKELGEVYEGAGLVALSWSDVPCRPRASIWIPASIKAPDQILTMLQRCNPHLPTSDWRVVKVDELEGPTNQAILILNNESLAPIEAAHGELNFGFSSVTVKVCKSDSAKED
ncbi:uncharacterized protein LOC120320857 [Drosophila yakuba]|uniref:uncharacterized protein LOC120320857 n=1 Tax=Drosophila yakuba TaxID=7245 RepID=UPI001930893B|nr:uncharacterized protein LOC120320857 [Drosophila yakuba]